MRPRAVVFPFALAAVAQAYGAPADIVSAFDADHEGWRAVNLDGDTYLPVAPAAGSFKPTTWNSATKDVGASEALFDQPGLFILLAPSNPYSGDLSAYYGGTVTFLLADTAGHDPNALYPSLLLLGLDTATNQTLAIGYKSSAPGTSPTPFSISLDASDPNWIASDQSDVTEAQFKSVLGHLTGFGINADWTTNGTDVVTLDSVRVAAVPEPTSLAALGLGALALLRRRKVR